MSRWPQGPPVPSAAELEEQLSQAGFTSVDSEQLIPNYWLFTAA